MESLAAINREITRCASDRARELDNASMYEEAIAQQNVIIADMKANLVEAIAMTIPFTGPLEAEATPYITMLEYELDGETDCIAEFERELNDCRSAIDALEGQITALEAKATSYITTLEYDFNRETEWNAEFERELEDRHIVIDGSRERILELKANVVNLIAYEEWRRQH